AHLLRRHGPRGRAGGARRLLPPLCAAVGFDAGSGRAAVLRGAGAVQERVHAPERRPAHRDRAWARHPHGVDGLPGRLHAARTQPADRGGVMTTHLPHLLDAIRRTLREAVAPEVASDHARSQLAAIDDILGKLAGMTVWSPQADEAQAHALRTGIEQFRSQAAGAPSVPALPQPAVAADVPALQVAEADISALVDWLDRARDALAPTVFSE